MHVEADDGAGAGWRGHVARSSRGASASDTPNFVRALAGGDVRVAAGVDVGVDADGDAGATAVARPRWRRCASTSPGDSALMARHAERDRPVELGARLADAGEDDVGGRESGAQGDLDLAAGVGVGAGAELRAGARDRRASSSP